MSYYLTNENSFLNINNAHLKVSGNVHADVMKIGAVEFAPTASNVTTTTNFTNVTTGLTTSSNLHVGGTLTMGTVEVIATTHNLENTTTNGNVTPHTVEFQNTGTSLVASGNVEVAKELTVSNVNMLHTANTAAIKLNSNVVTEFPRSKKLIKYPRVALTSAANNAYENGYKITYSSHYPGDHYPHGAFDNEKGSGSNTLWFSGANNHYNTSDGSAITDPNNANVAPKLDTNTDYGDWIGIELPNAIELKYFDLYQQYNTPNHFPQSATIYARKLTSDSWTEIYRYDNASRENEPNRATRFTVDSNIAYKYFALVGRQRNQETTGSNDISLGQWELFGVPEYDSDAHGTDVVIKSVPNVPNTDWLEVYYDAKGLTPGAVGSSISGLGGTTISATKLGDPQVSNDAFVFDGSGDAIVSGATSLSGNPPLSYSVWFKTNSISSGYGSNSIVQIGHSAGDKSLGFRIKGTGDTKPGNYRFYVWGGATNESVDTDIKAEIGTWTHATVVYDGLNSKLYIDGKFAVENTNTTTDLDLDSGAKVTLGNYIDSSGALYSGGEVRYYDGSIANVRLFNRAITQDEIYQLYAYQKEEFGHGDLGMTLKAGRLGIGTSEPRAVLDVRGDIFGPGIIQVQSTTFNGTASGTGTSFTTLSGLTTSITPKRTGSKILILLNLFWSGANDAYFQGNIKKDGTVLVKQEGSVGSASKTTFGAFGSYNRGIYALKNIGFSYLDDTNIGTKRIEYTIEVRNRAITATNYMDWWINYTSSTNDANRLTAVSTLTLIEIQQ